jgi:hypothetical protein
MSAGIDDLLDDPFHGSALRAYLEVWAETGQFPPDLEATRERAYRYYEEALAEKHRQRASAGPLSVHRAEPAET